eukprot:591265-Rhodomonas_salina.2
MQQIQKVIVENKIPPKFTLNTDETGLFYGQGQHNQWVPIGQTKGWIRGTAAHSTMKNSFTSAMTGNSNWDLLPQHLIMACTVGKADMSRVKVIDSLHAKPGFTAADGWTHSWWEKVLLIKLPKKKDTGEQFMMTAFKLPYLIHTDGTVVTCQKKAWMDTAGICMWVELVLKPWLDKTQNGCWEWGSILTWDHCWQHMTSAVLDTRKKCKIFAECLPKSMTDWLQVIDLVVNGPYKEHTLLLLCKDLRLYMQDFRMLFYRSKEGLCNSLKAGARMQGDTKFKDRMHKAFVQTGLVPLSGDVGNAAGDLHFCWWTGADPQGKLAATAASKLVGLLKLQEREAMTVGYLIDDSNLMEIANDEGDELDEDLFEEDTEDEGEDEVM